MLCSTVVVASYREQYLYCACCQVVQLNTTQSVQNMRNIQQFFFLHSCTVHLDTVKVFIYQLMHNIVALKEY
jgi:hypothetical protein